MFGRATIRLGIGPHSSTFRSSFTHLERLKIESSNFSHTEAMSNVSLGMTNYPQILVVGATWPILVFWGRIISLEYVKQDTSNLVHSRLTVVTTSDYHEMGRVYGHVTSKFW